MRDYAHVINFCVIIIIKLTLYGKMIYFEKTSRLVVSTIDYTPAQNGLPQFHCSFILHSQTHAQPMIYATVNAATSTQSKL